MTKKTHLALGLLLCLLLCVCLLPAAYADSAGAETFAALKNAIANGERDFNMSNSGTVVFTESLTVPSTMRLNASGTEIVVPSGVSLTVEGNCRVGTLTLQRGGHVTVADMGSANLTMLEALRYDSVSQFTVNRYMEIGDQLWRDDLKNLSFGEKGALAVVSHVTSDEALEAALAIKPTFPSKSFRRDIYIEYDWELHDDLDIQGFSIYVDETESSLTIKEGALLTIYNRLRVKDGHLQIDGAVINHGEFLLQRDRRPTGALVTMGATGGFIGTKPIAVFGDDPDSCLEGFDLSVFEKEIVPGAPPAGATVTIYTLTEMPLFTALKDAIANGERNYYMRNCGTVVFSESITIPNTTALHASGTEIVIPDGVTLTTDNFCGVGTLTLQPGGHVTVSDGNIAHLEVRDALNYDNINQFTLNGKLNIYSHIWRDDLKNLKLGEGGKVSVTYEVHSDGELANALANRPAFPNEKFYALLVMDYNCTLTDDMFVDDYALTIEAPGSLTIPAGKTLVCLNKVEVKDAPIYLRGRLLSCGDGRLVLHTDAILNISGEGFYAGKEIRVLGPKDQRDACISGLDISKLGKIINPDFTAYYLPADVVLPDGLTALGGESFANDSFHTVYIPAGVTSIAPDAFSGTDVAIIFGAAGSFVEEYADANGIPFLLLPSWYDVHNPQFVIVHE